MNLKNLIKPILCVLGGAALGGGVSYFFAHWEIKKLERRMDLFVEDVLAIVNGEEANPFDDDGVYDEILKSDDAEAVIEGNGNVTVNKSIQKPDISDLIVKHDLTGKMGINDGPFLVAENEIDLNDDKYDSEVAYTYYKDGILTNENDDPVVDPDNILPSGWRDCFGWNCKSDDTFFAINPKLRLLIEVGRAGYDYNGVYNYDREEE